MRFLACLFGMSRREMLGSLAAVSTTLLPLPPPAFGVSEAPTLGFDDLLSSKANPTPVTRESAREFIASQFVKDARVLWPLDGLPATGISRYAYVQGRVPPPAPPLSFPAFLEGTFTVRATFVKASFPQGPRGLSNVADANIAGYRMGSCIMLPNVGVSPAPYTQRFASAAGQVYADHAYNTPRRLEAFWPSAQLEAVRTYPFASGAGGGVPCYVSGNGCTAEENPGLHAPSARFGVTYGGPSWRNVNVKVQQTVDATVVAATSTTGDEPAAAGASAAFCAAQTYVQYNVEQGQQVAYTEFLELDPPPVGGLLEPAGAGVVRGKLRVAAFLSGPQPENEPGAAGDASSSSNSPDRRVAVALYDYDLVLEPAAANEEK